MACPVVLKQLMVSSRLVVPFRPAICLDRFSTTSTRTDSEQKTPNSSKSEDKDNLKLRVMKDFELRKYLVKFDIPNDINVTGIKQVMKAGILKATLPKLKKEEMLNLNSDDEILIKIS
nr:hypothetical protein [Tanacetum cinerariifolium]